MSDRPNDEVQDEVPEWVKERKPTRVDVACERCGTDTTHIKESKEQPLCDDCEEYVSNLEPPQDPHGGREMTPMYKRWH